MLIHSLMSTVIQMTDENERTRAFGLPKAELDAQLERYVLASVGTVGRNT